MAVKKMGMKDMVKEMSAFMMKHFADKNETQYKSELNQISAEIEEEIKHIGLFKYSKKLHNLRLIRFIKRQMMGQGNEGGREESGKKSREETEGYAKGMYNMVKKAKGGVLVEDTNPVQEVYVAKPKVREVVAAEDNLMSPKEKEEKQKLLENIKKRLGRRKNLSLDEKAELRAAEKELLSKARDSKPNETVESYKARKKEEMLHARSYRKQGKGKKVKGKK